MSARIINIYSKDQIEVVLKYHLLKPMDEICHCLNITADTYHHIIKFHGDRSKTKCPPVV